MSFIAGYLLGLAENGGSGSSGIGGDLLEAVKNAPAYHSMDLGGGYSLKVKILDSLYATREYSVVDGVPFMSVKARRFVFAGCLYRGNEFITGPPYFYPGGIGAMASLATAYAYKYIYSDTYTSGGLHYWHEVLKSDSTEIFNVSEYPQTTSVMFQVRWKTTRSYPGPGWEPVDLSYEQPTTTLYTPFGNLRNSAAGVCAGGFITDKTDREVEQVCFDLWKIVNGYTT